jgi:hypothetical protein
LAVVTAEVMRQFGVDAFDPSKIGRWLLQLPEGLKAGCPARSTCRIARIVSLLDQLKRCLGDRLGQLADLDRCDCARRRREHRRWRHGTGSSKSSRE